MENAPFIFRAVEELQPGPKWQRLFEERWPWYRTWFLQEGDAARPSYVASLRMLRTHLPETMPVYERLVALAGGGDVAARLLTLYRPPPYVTACSQGVWTRGAPVLVRNYDYAPSLFEGVIFSSAWTGRRVIGMSDCLWGLLDGMNDAGLAASLAFGGRRALGDGFGIPLVIRYVLETCATAGEARAVLARLPVHQAHNLTLVDRSGAVLTAYLAPDRAPNFRPSPAATNHQDGVEWPEHARATRTVERQRYILGLLEDPATTPAGLVAAFLQPPLYNTAYAGHSGTLYTATYRPAEGRVEYRWPDFVWRQSFDAFAEGTHAEVFVEGVGARRAW